MKNKIELIFNIYKIENNLAYIKRSSLNKNMIYIFPGNFFYIKNSRNFLFSIL